MKEIFLIVKMSPIRGDQPEHSDVCGRFGIVCQKQR